ncbi:hypothetical protein C8R44DRAFT_741631 [Mycena epipterygia]|nr:hypothetical protein C8R44DRAFT_741631 [Mycena epipterygia]
MYSLMDNVMDRVIYDGIDKDGPVVDHTVDRHADLGLDFDVDLHVDPTRVALFVAQIGINTMPPLTAFGILVLDASRAQWHPVCVAQTPSCLLLSPFSILDFCLSSHTLLALDLPSMQSEPDPQFVKRLRCHECGSPMGAVRPHSGSGGNQALRGRIVQTCSRAPCHWTCYHTEKAYIFEDAEAFVHRYNARLVGAAVPSHCNVPLRLAVAIDPPPVVNGTIFCNNLECKTAAGNPPRARDPCRNHGVPTVSDRAHLPAATGLNAPPVNAPPVNPAAAAQGAGSRQRLAQPIGPHWRQNHQAAEEAKGAIENLKTRRLAMEAREKRTCEFAIYHTAGKPPLIISQYIDTYPRLQLSQLSNLVEALKLTRVSVIDYWSGGGGWKIIDLASVLTVENERRILLKLRPSLLEELSLDDCIGLLDELQRQPRAYGKKRSGREEVISPLKKTAKTAWNPAITDASQAAHVIIDIDDDNNTTTPNPNPPLPPDNATLPLLPAVAVAVQPERAVKPKPRRNENMWIREMSVSRWHDGWAEIKRLQDKDPKFKAESAAFPEVFKKAYHKLTISNYKHYWNDIHEDLREKYLAMGNVPTASWAHIFLEAKTYRPRSSSITPSTSPTPEPLASTPRTPSATPPTAEPLANVAPSTSTPHAHSAGCG